MPGTRDDPMPPAGDSAPRGMTRQFPVLPSLRGYRTRWLGRDIPAGLAVAAVSLPTAIAYPVIVGLPPETGIYASMAAMVGYALFGPSRKLMVGPDAPTMTVLAGVVASAIAVMPAATPADRVAVASLIALCVGLICLAARMLRLGNLASLLSRPILTGFFAGISLSILIGQLGRVTGLKINSNGLIAPLVDLARQAGAIHWPSLTLAALMFAILQVVRVTRFPVPGPVIVVVLSVAASSVFGFEAMGIKVVGALPTGLPVFAVPSVPGLPLAQIVLGSAAVFLIVFGSGIIAARSFAQKTGEEVDPNAELVGFGAANLVAGFFGGFPVTASDSRTAVNLSVGGQSQVVSLSAAAALAGALLWFSDLLRILPIPALGAILIAAALSLIDIASLRQIWRVNPPEFLFAMIAMAGAISFGVLEGVMVAIVATLCHIIWKGMQIHVVMLGRIPGRAGFYKLHRSDQAKPVAGMAICLVEGSLLFFNSDAVKAKLRGVIAGLPGDTRWFVINATGIAQIDTTTAAMLDEVRAEVEARGIHLALAELNSEVAVLLERSGMLSAVGRTMIFDDLDDALRAFEGDQPNAISPVEGLARPGALSGA